MLMSVLCSMRLELDDLVRRVVRSRARAAGSDALWTGSRDDAARGVIGGCGVVGEATDGGEEDWSQFRFEMIGTGGHGRQMYASPWRRPSDEMGLGTHSKADDGLATSIGTGGSFSLDPLPPPRRSTWTSLARAARLGARWDGLIDSRLGGSTAVSELLELRARRVS